MRYIHWYLLLSLTIFFSFPLQIADATIPLSQQTILTFFKHQVIAHGSRTQKQIALTFDADMTPLMKYELQQGMVKSWYNQKVIDILNKTNTKATLFLTGMWMELYPKETKQLAKNHLFELENHSYSHPSFFGRCYGLEQIGEDAAKKEIQKTQQLLHTIAGIHNSFFRFPGGCYSQNDIHLMKQQGLTGIQWDVVGGDAFSWDTLGIESSVIKNVQNGSIIVLHLNGGPNAPNTAEALPEIIKELKAKGFEFVKIYELLNQTQG